MTDGRTGGTVQVMDDHPDPPAEPHAHAEGESCVIRDPVRDQAGLERLWCALTEPLGFRDRTLWLLFLDGSGQVAAGLTRVEDLPVTPGRDGVEALVHTLDAVRRDAGPGASVALLISRPGTRLDGSDRAWARLLATEAARVGLPLWPTHVATDQELRVVSPDDVSSPC